MNAGEKGLKGKLVAFSRQFETAQLLFSNQYKDSYGKYELLAAFGVKREISVSASPFQTAETFVKENRGWKFGHFSYELKNNLEDLSSRHPAAFNFGSLYLFEPLHVLVQHIGKEEIQCFSHDGDAFTALWQKFQPMPEERLPSLSWQAALSKEDYVKAFRDVQTELQYGNIYEVNLCQEFVAKSENDPYNYFNLLNKTSPMPFAGFYKHRGNYLICASPERFICLRGKKLISQPMKGTAARGANELEDEAQKKKLRNNLKETTENVMIVDLVRNDLSRSAERATIEVEELFGIYTFPQVHQLISTISCTLRSEISPLAAIKNAFPMGSMTGAPKISAMKIIDRVEAFRRELYSGSIGYFDPEGDFDLNVVIRSLLYRPAVPYLSLRVGGAITIDSNAEEEYRECLLKAKAFFDLNNHPIHA